jgi:cephalosporin-C deacetylase-like acetyl esterase
MNQNNLVLLAKENIVGDFSRKLIESLMECLFRTVPEEDRKKINTLAYDDFKRNGDMVEKFAKVIGVDRNVLPPNADTVFSAIKKLPYTKGNSIYEKLLNLIVYQYYQPSPQIRRFFQIKGIEEYIDTVYKLNRIRNSASHSTDKPFTDKDYDYYIEHIFDVANRLLESLEEEA